MKGAAVGLDYCIPEVPKPHHDRPDAPQPLPQDAKSTPGSPDRALGLLIPWNLRISTPRLKPPAWINARLATFSLTHNCSRRIPPVS